MNLSTIHSKILMKLLILHNRYNQRGGEDSVFEAESALLREHGEIVQTLEFTNDSFSNGWRRLVGGILSIFNPFSFVRVLRTIRKFRPDVLHIHNLFSTATPSVIWAAKILRVPVVMTLHNFRLICPSATLLYDGKVYEKSLRSFFPFDAVRKRVYRDSFMQTLALAMTTTLHRCLGTWKLVNRFIVLSQFSKAKFLESKLGVPANHLIVKPNFVADRGSAFTKGNDFLFVGRLSPEKGIPILLDAFIGTSNSLTVVGDGPLRNSVESAVLQSPNIRYLGSKSGADVIDLMRNAKALVFPSIWYEGMPMVILESFSVATPVIASRLGTMAEIIQDQLNGLHFEPSNAVDLRKAVETLSKDSALHAQLCQGARETWERLYSPDRNYELLMQVYHEGNS